MIYRYWCCDKGLWDSKRLPPLILTISKKIFLWPWLSMCILHVNNRQMSVLFITESTYYLGGNWNILALKSNIAIKISWISLCGSCSISIKVILAILDMAHFLLDTFEGRCQLVVLYFLVGKTFRMRMHICVILWTNWQIWIWRFEPKTAK